MRKLTFAAILLMVAVGSSLAQTPAPMGQMEGMPPGHPPMGMMGHGRMGMMGDDDGPAMMMGCMKGLDLTDEQQAKLEKIHFNHQRKQIERKAAMVDLQSKLKLAITAEKFNQKDIDDLAGKIGKFHQEAVLLKVSNLREVREVLTPEQRVQFDQNVLNMGPGMGGMRMGMGKGMRKGMGMGMGGGECNDCDGGMGHGKKSCE